MVSHAKLGLIDGIAHRGSHLEARLYRFFQAGGVEEQAVAPGLFGSVHGLVGGAQHVADGLCIVRVTGNADTRRDKHIVRPQLKGLFQGREDVVGGGLQIRGLAEAGKGDGELVAAQARHRVGFAHALGDALGGLDQQLIALVVSERVVDFLEAIEVDKEHGQVRLVATRAFDFLVQAVDEQPSIGQVGQHVVVGLVPDHRLGTLLFGDVVEQGDKPVRLAVIIEHRVHGQPAGNVLTGLGLVPDFAFPGAGRQHGAPNLAEELARMIGRFELGQTIADDVVLAVTGQAGKRRVDADHLQVGIGDDNGLAALLKNRVRQAQGFFRALAFRDIAQGTVDNVRCARLDIVGQVQGAGDGARLALFANLELAAF